MDDLSVSASVMSMEALIMSLLGQIQCLESERDNARILAARMKERLELVQNNNNLPSLRSSNDRNLARIVKEVSMSMLNEVQQIITNEEHRYYNLKELSAEKELTDESSANFQAQIAVCKQHYEELLAEAENEKVELRKKLKAQQDMLLDRDIKIKDLERKIESFSASTEGAK